MGARRRLILLALACLSLTGAACARKEAPPAPAPPAEATDDRLAEGEIPEGRERAFTLPLPLRSTVKARFGRSVHVASAHTREELARFVRSRVTGGETSSGAVETRFDRVVVTGDPSRTLSIQIRTAPIAGEHRSQMVIDDVTVPPEEPGLTIEDRYRKAGLTPDGKLLDREHLQ